MVSRNNEWCHNVSPFPVLKIFWLSISLKATSQKWWSAKLGQCYLKISKEKHDIQTFRDGIISDSKKRDIQNKEKFSFLLLSANKSSWCSVIQTWFLWNNNYLPVKLNTIIENLVSSFMKTADVSKLSLLFFERIYNGLYLCYFLWL